MAIFVALQSPEVEVIGLTTIYGNVYTTLATRNALHLLEVAGRTDIPVAEGSHVTITKGTKLRIADFVHGADGLGNQNFPPPKGKPIEQSAAAFLVEQANLYPGKVTVVALGPLTNIALATQLEPAFAKNIGQIVLLGGAFAVNGNVNPAAEANIFGDPDAADMVFTSGADILGVGINVTHQVVLTDADREKLARSNGKFAQYLCKILDVYFSYHRDAYSTKGVYLHDPTALLAAVNPSLITYTEGVVRVQTNGITRGLTILYNKQKRFGEVTEWSDKPTVKVAVTVDAPAVVNLVMERLIDS
ncbi:probable uridine nucleosidase 2 isoform X2 [Prunus avium]|nr:probable uridine nucleosidase 2 isoform X2 [Prunus avium]XP_021814137.1 probable uridine nucleosidase 2 isoform X2 [Prunus avium]